MKKMGLLAIVIGLLITAPAVVAGTSATTCMSAKYRAIGLRVHGVSCRSAYKEVTKLSEKGYKCKQHGTKIPIKVTCVKNKHHSHYFTWVFHGG